MSIDTAFALMVAVTPPDRWGEKCVAWVESRDAVCGKDVKHGFLCARHYTVAQRRWEKQQAKREAQEKQRAQYRAQHMPEWLAERDRIDAEITRRTKPLTTDRAFSGGVGTAQHKKHVQRQFSESNVQRVGELARRRQKLEALIGDQNEH